MTIMGFQYVYVYYIHGMDYGTLELIKMELDSSLAKSKKIIVLPKISFFILKNKIKLKQLITHYARAASPNPPLYI